jgi:hypothetical protein
MKIYCDVQDTVMGSISPTKNAHLILSFMKAAIDNGHTASMVSTIGRETDMVLSLEFGEEITPFLPTLKKQKNGEYIKCDILIDDSPIMIPFNQIAKIWIDSNSSTLADELETIAKEHLGFVFKAPANY